MKMEALIYRIDTSERERQMNFRQREKETRRGLFFTDKREREREEKLLTRRAKARNVIIILFFLSHTQHTCFLLLSLSLSANRTIVVVGDILLGSRAQYTHTHISSSVWIKCVFTYFDRDIQRERKKKSFSDSLLMLCLVVSNCCSS